METGNPNQSQPSINLADIPYIECEKCQGTVFEPKLKLKKISKFMTGSNKDQVVPVEVVVCASCGHINEMFEPKV